MGSIISIHQPNYLPWLGFFHKVKNSNVFVILDAVQFDKESYTHRTRIKTPQDWMWLTIPVGGASHNEKINEIQLPQEESWKKKHIMSLEMNYKKAPFYETYLELIEMYSTQKMNLVDFNIDLIRYLLDCLDIHPDIYRQSELNIDPELKKTDLLVSIVKALGGTVYLSGTGAKNYMELNKFAKAGIEVRYQNFKHPVYPQRFKEFIPNLSVVDLLFNVGESGKNLIV